MIKNRLMEIIIILFLIVICSFSVIAEDNCVDLTVRDARIKDVLMMLSEQSNINIVPDETVQGKVTINLKNVEIQEAMRTLSMAYGYSFRNISKNVYMVTNGSFAIPPKIEVKGNKISVETKEAKLQTILNTLDKKLKDIKINIVPSLNKTNSPQINNITIAFSDLNLEKALTKIAREADLSWSKRNNLYYFTRTNSNFYISVKDNMVTLDAKQVEMTEVLRAISKLTGKNMVLFNEVRGTINLRLKDYSIKALIETILAGSRFTYRIVDDTYLIGSKNFNTPSAGILTMNRLISLDYIQAEELPELLARNLSSIEVKVISEQNALMVTGSQEDIKKVEDYVEKLDVKTPQVVVEALILEVSHDKTKDPTLKLGMDYENEDGTVFFE